MNKTVLALETFQLRRKRKQVHEKLQCKAEFIFSPSLPLFFSPFCSKLLLSMDNVGVSIILCLMS